MNTNQFRETTWATVGRTFQNIKYMENDIYEKKFNKTI